MSNKMKLVSTYEVFPIINELLSQNHMVKFTVSGNSMLPLIASGRDQVLVVKTSEKDLGRGDIVLFRINDKYILHRIYKVTSKGYHTIGDACLTEDGIVNPDDILGVVEIIYRKGKEIKCRSFLWRSVFYSWIILLPVRKYILSFYSLIGRIKRKIRTVQILKE